MNYSIKTLIILMLSLHTIYALTDKEVISFIDGTQTSEVHYIPSGIGLGNSVTAFVVLNYDENIIEGLFNLIESNEYSDYWKAALIHLRIIATCDPDLVGLERSIKHTNYIENITDLDSEKKLSILSSAYGLVARFAQDKSKSFLKQRIDPKFWKNRELESKVFVADAPQLNTTHTGVTEAIMAIAEMGNDEAKEILSRLLKDERYANLPNVLRRIKAAQHYRNSAELMIAGIQSEYAKRLEIRGDPNALDAPDEARAAPQQASQTSPKPTTPKTAPEPSPEPPASSQSWLWLVIVAVGVIALGLVLKRK